MGSLRLEIAKKELVIGDYRQRLVALTQVCDQEEAKIKKLEAVAKSRQTQIEVLRKQVKARNESEFNLLNRLKELEGKIRENGVISEDIVRKASVISDLKSKLEVSSKRMGEFEASHLSCVSNKKWSRAVERARNAESKVKSLDKEIEAITAKYGLYARCLERVVEVVSSHSTPKQNKRDPAIEDRANKLSREILGIPLDFLNKRSRKKGECEKFNPLPELRELIKEEDEDKIVAYVTGLILNK